MKNWTFLILALSIPFCFSACKQSVEVPTLLTETDVQQTREIDLSPLQEEVTIIHATTDGSSNDDDTNSEVYCVYKIDALWGPCDILEIQAGETICVDCTAADGCKDTPRFVYYHNGEPRCQGDWTLLVSYCILCPTGGHKGYQYVN